ncbi:heparan sulfate 2-O-sulfotransferase 1-like [Pomacea canaliculata]|uniref:heparan sulfate 2-O-sulfotransferase 1-like n=1 Tax=Pomacea canaliculata TaxID=400727 RepID=UPI000D73F3F9|nr:heparan sulfate 2-O-sulfotransferase 1-like [Pomacea canaliculata]
MLRRAPHGMQVRHIALMLVVVAFVVVFFCLHLLAEVTRLDDARIKLERAVSKLQQDSIDSSRRHLSFAEEQDSSDGGVGGEDMIVIYNRVPKTGSTSFAGIVYDLCKSNKFHVVHINMTKNAKTLALSDQVRFINNISSWQEKKPAFYHGHLAFIDFSKFGVQKTPIYINLIRDPLDRLVSYYYFLRYGDDFRPYMKRRKAGNKETFDQCVERNGEDCDPENLWLQIPFFCGHAMECWVPGSRWALEQAKQNVLLHYLLVGVTEELGDFIAVLEATLPRFFKDATQMFNNGRKSHLRRTLKKSPPLQGTIDKIHESPIWKMENEFYTFVLEQFHYIKQQTFDVVEGEYLEKGHRYQYEKIRPR